MTFIESVVNHDKNEYVNKRHLLVCNRCCWCLSYLPDLKWYNRIFWWLSYVWWRDRINVYLRECLKKARFKAYTEYNDSIWELGNVDTAKTFL